MCISNECVYIVGEGGAVVSKRLSIGISGGERRGEIPIPFAQRDRKKIPAAEGN